MSKTIYTYIISILILSSCAGMPRKSPDISHCADGDLHCIDLALDADRFDHGQDNLYQFYQGYQPASLVELKEMDRLKVEEINPAMPIMSALGFGMWAYTEIWSHEDGDILAARINYCSWCPFANQTYMHEAMHAQGFKGNWWQLHSDMPYSAKQKRIMENEGVKRWTQTEYYKWQNNQYHW